MVFAMTLEVIGIGLIIPAIVLLLKGPQELSEVTILKYFYQYTEQLTNEYVLIYGLVFILIIYLIKYFILGFLYFYQYNFTSKLMLRISSNILSNYLKKPYDYFLNASSSKLINNLIKQVEIFITQGLEPLITIFSETIVLVGILIALIYIDFHSVIFFLAVILIPSLFIYLLIKNTVKKWGDLQQVNDEKVLETLQHTLHGIKEIKIFRREDSFSSLFYSYFLLYQHYQQ
jgi:ABC-type multidrug transport system fused ATPase/permease subunit